MLTNDEREYSQPHYPWHLQISMSVKKLVSVETVQHVIILLEITPVSAILDTLEKERTVQVRFEV